MEHNRPEAHNQPFCIIGSKGRFAPCYSFYLPPLETESTVASPPLSYATGLPILRYHFYKPKHLNWKRVTEWSKIYDLEGYIKLLEGRINELEKPKKRRKDVI